METSIGRVKTTLQALHLLDRFSRLNIKKLGVEEKYRQLFLQFGEDIEAVKHVRWRQFIYLFAPMRYGGPWAVKLSWPGRKLGGRNFRGELSRKCLRKLSASGMAWWKFSGIVRG